MPSPPGNTSRAHETCHLSETLRWKDPPVATCSSCGASLPGGARFCPNCAAPVAKERPSEERKLATVLFADLVGSTEMAGSQDAERTRALLNRFYDAMAAEIADAGGTIEKFIGDAVVAAFGAPVAQENHAERALHAALSMRRTLGRMFGDTLRLRIGVNTGDVVVGEPRVGSSFVTGDAVNVAARLEQGAKPGEILVGERTVAAVRTEFQFGPVTTIAAKGKAEGVACHRLLEVAAPTVEPDLLGTFVGREPELEAVLEAYAGAKETQRPVLVTILGEPGIGKSTLVRAFRRWLAAGSPRPAERVGRCRSFGQASAYSPLGEVVGGHPDLLERWPILGVALGQPAPPDLHPLAVVQRLREAWVELLEELAAAGPLVVVIEDLHWADHELLDLLEATRRVQGPLLLLGTARHEVELNARTIRLDPLPSPDALRIVDGFAPETLAQDVRTFVVERSDGNPLFVEEIMRMLADRGVKDAIPQDLVVPDTVQALLAERIDLLAPAEKAALQAAAVIGRTFGAYAVRELISDEPRFDMLAERGFVRSAATELAFVHALTREVAYGSLTTPTRARLHARYAEWLEVEGGGRDEDAAALAHHYAEAVRPEGRRSCLAGRGGGSGPPARAGGRLAAARRDAGSRAVRDAGSGRAARARGRARDGPPGARGDLGGDRPRERPLLRRQGIRLSDGGGDRTRRRWRVARRPASRAGFPDHGAGGHVGNASSVGPGRRLDLERARACAAGQPRTGEGSCRALLLRLRQVRRGRRRSEPDRRAGRRAAPALVRIRCAGARLIRPRRVPAGAQVVPPARRDRG